jgi:hypothetical protein
MKQPQATLAILTLAIAWATTAIAQDERSEPTAGQSTSPPEQPGDTSTVIGSVLHQPTNGARVTLRGGYRLQFETNLDDAPGEHSVNRALFGVSLAGSINDDTEYALDFQAEQSSYDFSGATSLAPGTGDPLDDALSFILTPSFRFAVNDAWAVRAGGAIIVAGETDADADESIRGSLFGGVEHRLSDKLTLTLLLVAWTRLEDDAIIFPMIGVSWQINDLMRLQTRGLGAEFISDLGNGWSLGARAAWEYREFRLRDESSAPLPDGVLRDTGVIVSAELAWKPSPDIVLALEAGGVVASEFELLNGSGDTISETDSDSAFFVGIRASFAF